MSENSMSTISEAVPQLIAEPSQNTLENVNAKPDRRKGQETKGGKPRSEQSSSGKPKEAIGNQTQAGSGTPSQRERGPGKLRGQPRDSPEVRMSKTLSWLLRHGAKSEGLKMRPDGYVRVSDLVSQPGSVIAALIATLIRACGGAPSWPIRNCSP